MKWPWVSRSSRDAVQAECDRLNARLDMLLDHRRRVERKEAGLSEVPHREKPKQDMPPEVWALYRQLYGDSGSHTQTMQRKEMFKLADQAGWDAVKVTLMEELGA